MTRKTETKIFEWTKLIILPLTIALTATAVTKCSEDKKTDQQYVQLAINILAEEVPEGANQSNPPLLRKWAIEILNQCAPVKFSKDDQQALLSGATKFPRLRNGESYLEDSNGSIITTEGGQPFVVPGNPSKGAK